MIKQVINISSQPTSKIISPWKIQEVISHWNRRSYSFFGLEILVVRCDSRRFFQFWSHFSKGRVDTRASTWRILHGTKRELSFTTLLRCVKRTLAAFIPSKWPSHLQFDRLCFWIWWKKKWRQEYGVALFRADIYLRWTYNAHLKKHIADVCHRFLAISCRTWRK